MPEGDSCVQLHHTDRGRWREVRGSGSALAVVTPLFPIVIQTVMTWSAASNVCRHSRILASVLVATRDLTMAILGNTVSCLLCVCVCVSIMLRLTFDLETIFGRQVHL